MSIELMLHLSYKKDFSLDAIVCEMKGRSVSLPEIVDPLIFRQMSGANLENTAKNVADARGNLM